MINTGTLALTLAIATSISAPQPRARSSHGPPEGAAAGAALRELLSSSADPAPLRLPAPQEPAEGFDQLHALWSSILAEHVRDDRFDYKALKGNRSTLDSYLKTLHAVAPSQLSGWSRDQRFAFWINTYNAHVVSLIVDNYPLDSIKDLGGVFSSVWNKEFIPMQAHHPDDKDDKLSLDDVEHKIIRAQFKDARLHAAVNCASIGCPPLLNTAFVAKKLDAQLDSVIGSFILDGRRNRLDREAKTLYLSEIFSWFEADFERDADSVKEFILRHTPEDGDYGWVRTARIKHLDYSWRLNDLVREGR